MSSCCYRCGGYPNHPNKSLDVFKLIQCDDCGTVACIQHRKGMVGGQCAECGSHRSSTISYKSGNFGGKGGSSKSGAGSVGGGNVSGAAAASAGGVSISPKQLKQMQKNRIEAEKMGQQRLSQAEEEKRRSQLSKAERDKEDKLNAELALLMGSANLIKGVASAFNKGDEKSNNGDDDFNFIVTDHVAESEIDDEYNNKDNNKNNNSDLQDGEEKTGSDSNSGSIGGVGDALTAAAAVGAVKVVDKLIGNGLKKEDESHNSLYNKATNYVPEEEEKNIKKPQVNINNNVSTDGSKLDNSDITKENDSNNLSSNTGGIGDALTAAAAVGAVKMVDKIIGGKSKSKKSEDDTLDDFGFNSLSNNNEDSPENNGKSNKLDKDSGEELDEDADAEIDFDAILKNSQYSDLAVFDKEDYIDIDNENDSTNIEDSEESELSGSGSSNDKKVNSNVIAGGSKKSKIARVHKGNPVKVNLTDSFNVKSNNILRVNDILELKKMSNDNLLKAIAASFDINENLISLDLKVNTFIPLDKIDNFLNLGEINLLQEGISITTGILADKLTADIESYIDQFETLLPTKDYIHGIYLSFSEDSKYTLEEQKEINLKMLEIAQENKKDVYLGLNNAELKNWQLIFDEYDLSEINFIYTEVISSDDVFDFIKKYNISILLRADIDFEFYAKHINDYKNICFGSAFERITGVDASELTENTSILADILENLYYYDKNFIEQLLNISENA